MQEGSNSRYLFVEGVGDGGSVLVLVVLQVDHGVGLARIRLQKLDGLVLWTECQTGVR